MANFKQYIKTSFQDYGLPSDGHGVSQDSIRDDINYLYQKVKDFSREVTQWDLYKITQVVTNQENFKSQVNNLPPYSSAIIAARFIGDDGRTYNQGDLVYKKLDGTTQHINAERGGVFYPSQIKKLEANNYTINFQYLNQEPSEDKDATVTIDNDTWTVETPLQAQKIPFQGLTTEDSTLIYGIVETPNNNAISVITLIKHQEIDIIPIIKLYSNNEEVYGDYTITSLETTGENENYTTWSITDLPSIVDKVVIK